MSREISPIPKTFDELYSQMYSPLVKRAKSILKNKFNAEDIVQEVFLKTLDYKLRNPDSFLSPYIVSRNLIIACSADNRKVKEDNSNE